MRLRTAKGTAKTTFEGDSPLRMKGACMGVYHPWHMGGHQCPRHQQLSSDTLSRRLTSRNRAKEGNPDWAVTTFYGQLNPVVIRHDTEPYTFRQPSSLFESHPFTHCCSLCGCLIPRIGSDGSFLLPSSLEAPVPPTACESLLPSLPAVGASL